MPASRTEYTPLLWVNESTELSAENLNHIEQGVSLNNALAIENALFIDEIYTAFVEQLNIEYDNQTDTFTFSFGSTSSQNPTNRFHKEINFSLSIPVNLSDKISKLFNTTELLKNQVKIYDYLYYDDDTSQLLFPLVETEFTIREFSSKGIPDSEYKIDFEAENISIADNPIASCNQVIRLYQTGLKADISTDKYAYDNIDIPSKKINRYTRVISLPDFVRMFPQTGNADVAWQWSSSGNGRITIKHTLLDAQGIFTCNGFILKSNTNTELKFYGLSGVNLAIENLKSIDDSITSKAKAIEELTKSIYNDTYIVFKRKEVLQEDFSQYELNFLRTEFICDGVNQISCNGFSGCIQTTFFSQKELFYSKDQVDAKFIPLTYMNDKTYFSTIETTEATSELLSELGSKRLTWANFTDGNDGTVPFVGQSLFIRQRIYKGIDENDEPIYEYGFRVFSNGNEYWYSSNGVIDLMSSLHENILNKISLLNDQSQISGGTYPRLLKYSENKLYLFLDNQYRVSNDGGKTWSEPTIIFTPETERERATKNYLNVNNIDDVGNAFPILLGDSGRIAVFYRCHSIAENFYSIAVCISDTNGENFGTKQELFHSTSGYWEPFYYKGWIYYSSEHDGSGSDKAQSIYRRTLNVDLNGTVAVGSGTRFLDGRNKVDTDGNTNDKSRIGMISASPIEGGHIFVFESSVNINASTPRPMVVQYCYVEHPENNPAQPTPVVNLFLGSSGKKCGAPFVTTLDDGRIVISFQTNENYTGYNRTDFRDNQFVAFVSKRKVNYGDELTADNFVKITTYEYGENEYGVWGSVSNIDGILYKTFSIGKNTSSSGSSAYGNLVQKCLLEYNTADKSVATKEYVDSHHDSTKADLVNGIVPASQLPSYVDDVIEFTKQVSGSSWMSSVLETEPGTRVWNNATAANLSGGTSSPYYKKFLINTDGTESGLIIEDPMDGKIYVGKTDTNTYRWSGSNLVEISKSVGLGETASTAYAGNKGKANAQAIEALQTNKADKTEVAAVQAKTRTITITQADWVNSAYSINLGTVVVGANDALFISPADSCAQDYYNAGIVRSISNDGNTLTLTAATTPTNSITIQLVYLKGEAF